MLQAVDKISEDDTVEVVVPSVQTESRGGAESPVRAVAAPYIPPYSLILRGLGISEKEMNRSRVSVSTDFLRMLIGELAGRGGFDRQFYAARYPDVEGARLAGDIPSLYAHYISQGYFEGRLPRELPFDPEWYLARYEDLASVFTPEDRDSLRQHFENQGFHEGRAGTPDHRRDSDRWVEAARDGG